MQGGVYGSRQRRACGGAGSAARYAAPMIAMFGLILMAAGGLLLWIAYKLVRRITGGGRDSAAGLAGCAGWAIAGPIGLVGALLFYLGLTIFGL